jgi:hypothetical protein
VSVSSQDRKQYSGSGPHWSILHRLLITCPVTGRPADTGYELSAAPTLGSGQQRLVDCLECGQDHPWAIEDTFLD